MGASPTPPRRSCGPAWSTSWCCGARTSPRCPGSSPGQRRPLHPPSAGRFADPASQELRACLVHELVLRSTNVAALPRLLARATAPPSPTIRWAHCR
ncbi:DUF6183 family protein [Kitasatospora sp. CB01950]|uniref:DUF6183 family protein n=1 Tax=Kitasatospora sp. CB01950 TaxID=1703930 RepID=UPI003FCE19C1